MLAYNMETVLEDLLQGTISESQCYDDVDLRYVIQLGSVNKIIPLPDWLNHVQIFKWCSYCFIYYIFVFIYYIFVLLQMTLWTQL